MTGPTESAGRGGGRFRGRGRGRGREIGTSQPSQPPQPPDPPLHILSSEPLNTAPRASVSRNFRPRPPPIITKPLQTAPIAAPTPSPTPNSQFKPPSIITKPLQTAPVVAPTPSPSPNSQIRPSLLISQPLQTAPIVSPTSAPSPHSQLGSIDTSNDPASGTSSLILENIKWGSRDEQGRIWIRSAPGNNFQPEFRVRGAITRIFKEKFDGAWTSWTNVDEAMRDIWFKEFKAKYKWLENDEENIKRSFRTRGSLALKNALFKVRSGEDEGGWIGAVNLQQLRVQWDAEDWQKISSINKKNRQAQEGHNVHSGGSISAREHAKKMKVELNREPTMYELYERLHRPKGKPNEWLNEKQARLAEIYQSQVTKRQSQCGEDSSEQSTKQSDDDIFLEVVGGINKKGRIFGIGSQAATVRASLKESISIEAASSEEVAMLKDKVQALTTELQQKNLEQESIKQKVDRYERMFERLMRDKNLKALLVEPEGEAGDYNGEMDEDEMHEDYY